jgi:Carboxypeptidase regulatory-like domain
MQSRLLVQSVEIGGSMGKAIIASCFVLAVLATAALPGQRGGGKIVGRVIDEETLKTLPAEIAIAGRDDRNLFLRHTRASEAGLFEITDLPSGDLFLTTKLKGYAVDHLSVSLNNGETRYVEFYLKHGKTVRGVIYDRSQNPVGNVRVSVTYAPDESEVSPVVVSYQWERGEAMTDQLGRFEISNLHPEKRFIIEASHSGFPSTTLAPMRFKPEDKELSLTVTLRE